LEHLEKFGRKYIQICSVRHHPAAAAAASAASAVSAAVAAAAVSAAVAAVACHILRS